MTPAEEERLTTLPELMEQEQDPQKLKALLDELLRLLSEHQRTLGNS